jgi:hypothetical protein
MSTNGTDAAVTDHGTKPPWSAHPALAERATGQVALYRVRQADAKPLYGEVGTAALRHDARPREGSVSTTHCSPRWPLRGRPCWWLGGTPRTRPGQLESGRQDVRRDRRPTWLRRCPPDTPPSHKTTITNEPDSGTEWVQSPAHRKARRREPWQDEPYLPQVSLG